MERYGGVSRGDFSFGVSSATPAQPVSRSPSVVTPTTNAATPLTISPQGALLSKLKELSSNRDAFATFARDAANYLKAAASSPNAGAAQGALESLATGFQKAARTGALPTREVAQLANPNLPGAAQLALESVTQRIDAALGLRPAPDGPWLPRWKT